MLKFVVTGAGSFIGKAVVNKLTGSGHKVYAYRHTPLLESPLPEEGADVWIHFAWAGVGSKGRGDISIQEANVSMAMDALEMAVRAGCRAFLFAGSQAEYGRAQDGTLKKEAGPAEPVSAYGKAKLMVLKKAPQHIRECGETYMPKRRMSYIHMRLFSVYGPGDHKTSLISTLVEKLAGKEEISLGHCTQLWDYLYIDDAARAIIKLALSEGASGIYNIGSGDVRPLREYVLEAAEIMGAERRLLHFGEREDNAEGPADLSPSLERIKSLGFMPGMTFKNGLLETLGLKGNPGLPL